MHSGIIHVVGLCVATDLLLLLQIFAGAATYPYQVVRSRLQRARSTDEVLTVRQLCIKVCTTCSCFSRPIQVKPFFGLPINCLI